MKRLLLPVFGIVAVLALALAPAAVAQNPHFVKTPTCTSSTSDNSITVSCTGGKIAGVGTEPTQVGIDVQGGCANNPGHLPPGHNQAVSQPIQPKGGNIVFGPLSVTVSCPPGLTPVVGSSVTYFIVQDGQTTVIGRVPIT
jgi:hypothetical protein